MGTVARLAVIGASCVLVSGCAQYQTQQAQKQILSARQALSAVCQQVMADPRLDPTRRQIADAPLKTTVAQMADPTFPTPAQRDAIEHRQDYSQPCIQAREQYLSTYAPAALPIYQQAEQNERAMLAWLLGGKVTFGQFNTERSKAAGQAWAAMQDAERTRVAQAQQLQIQRQQAAAQSAQYNLNLMRAFTPHQTNCTRFGNSVNCVGQ